MRKITENDIYKIQLVYGCKVSTFNRNKYYGKIRQKSETGGRAEGLVGSNGLIQGYAFNQLYDLSDYMVLGITEPLNGVVIAGRYGVFNIGLSEINSYTVANKIVLIHCYNEGEYLVTEKGKKKKISNSNEYTRIVDIGNNQFALLHFLKEYLTDTTRKIDVYDYKLNLVRADIELNSKFAEEYKVKRLVDFWGREENKIIQLSKPIS